MTGDPFSHLPALSFSALSDDQQRVAKHLFLDAGVNDGYWYRLDSGVVFCRFRPAAGSAEARLAGRSNTGQILMGEKIGAFR